MLKSSKKYFSRPNGQKYAVIFLCEIISFKRIKIRFLLKIVYICGMKPKDEIKEQKIKEVTLEVVVEKGMAGVKMNHVAKAAQISPSMIYTYFKNKEDLLFQVFRDCIRNLINEVIVQRQEELPFKARLARDFENIISLKLNKSKEYNYIRKFIHSPYFKSEYRQILDTDAGKYLFALFEEGQKKMILKDHIPIDILFALFDGISDRLVDFHKTQKIQLTPEITQQAFSLVWDGLRQ